MNNDSPITLWLHREDTAALAGLVEQLVDLIEGRGGVADPALDRLFPEAYRDDVDSALEFRRLTEQSLAEHKIAGARAVIAAIGRSESAPVRIPPDEATTWLTTLNDLRLTLAARGGMDDDGEMATPDQDIRVIFDWLSSIQAAIVDQLP